MLDQPVQTPLTSNPKVNQNKIFASLGIILVVAILIIGSLWIYLNSKGANRDNLNNNSEVKVSSVSAKPAEVASSSATESWKLATNTALGYSIKYPESWLAVLCTVGNTIEIDDSQALKKYVNPDSSKVLGAADICNSDARYRIIIGLNNGGNSSFSMAVAGWDSSSQNFTDYSKEETTIAGHKAYKFSGVTTEDIPGVAVGTKYVEYEVEYSNKSLEFNYYTPKDTQDETYKDVSTEFEEIVHSLKFF